MAETKTPTVPTSNAAGALTPTTAPTLVPQSQPWWVDPRRKDPHGGRARERLRIRFLLEAPHRSPFARQQGVPRVGRRPSLDGEFACSERDLHLMPVSSNWIYKIERPNSSHYSSSSCSDARTPQGSTSRSSTSTPSIPSSASTPRRRGMSSASSLLGLQRDLPTSRSSTGTPTSSQGSYAEFPSCGTWQSPT